MNKEKIFIIFTDLDYTFTPIGMNGLSKFIELVKKIEQKENVKVKVAPITGRQTTYVTAITNMLRWIFQEKGILEIIDYAGAEQGSIMLDLNKADSPIYLDGYSSKIVENKVKHLMENAKISKYLQKNKYNFNLISYFIKEELSDKMSAKMQEEILLKFRKMVKNNLKDKVNVSFAKDCVEILPSTSGKHKALDWILQQYSQNYEIVGATFSGDSENDYLGVKRFLELGKNNKKKIHVIIPKNGSQKLKDEVIQNNTEKGFIANKELFEGIMDVLENLLEHNKLVGEPIELSCKYEECKIVN